MITTQKATRGLDPVIIDPLAHFGRLIEDLIPFSVDGVGVKRHVKGRGTVWQDVPSACNSARRCEQRLGSVKIREVLKMDGAERHHGQ